MLEKKAFLTCLLSLVPQHSLAGTACGKSRQCCSQSRAGAGRLLWRLQLCLFRQIWIPVAAAGSESRTASSGWERRGLPARAQCCCLLSPARGGPGVTPVTGVSVISTCEPARAGGEHRRGWHWMGAQGVVPPPLSWSLGLGSAAGHPHLQGEELVETLRNLRASSLGGSLQCLGTLLCCDISPHCWGSARPA